ncbi:MAG: helix-turn-helix transcriptional regulator [Gammaproteobacteria bacterium]|nr:helix-turn-helix transcriptional regulator [Gammaproteobacteria bacterium]
MSTIPDWYFPDHLEEMCACYRKQYQPQRSRPRHSFDEVRDAAHRYDRSVPGSLSWNRVFIAVLYFHAQLKRGAIVAIVGIQHPQAYIDRFRPFLLDPHYNPKSKKRTGKHSELRGLTVAEAAEALGCSVRSIYQYLQSPEVVGRFLRMVLDQIFVYLEPPPVLVAAANEKKARQIQHYRNKHSKYF